MTAVGMTAGAVRVEAAPEVMRRRHQLGEVQREGVTDTQATAAGNRDVAAQFDAKHDEEMHRRRHVTFQAARAADAQRALQLGSQQVERVQGGSMDGRHQAGGLRRLSEGELPVHVHFQQPLGVGSQRDGLQQAEGMPQGRFDGQQQASGLREHLDGQQQAASGLRALWLRGQLAGLRRSVLDLQQERVGYEQAGARQRSL